MSSPPNPMLDLLTQLGADKPEWQPLLDAMRAQQHTYAEELVDEPADQEPTRDELLLQNEQLVALLKRARHEIKRLDATVNALEQEVEATGQLHAELAAALGACPACWGTDRACPGCRGRGRPGAYPADQPLYAHYVRPAARRQQELARPGTTPAPAAVN